MAQAKNNKDRFTWGAGDIVWTKKPPKKNQAKQTKKGKK